MKAILLIFLSYTASAQFYCDFVQYGERVDGKSQMSKKFDADYTVKMTNLKIDLIDNEEENGLAQLRIIFKFPTKTYGRKNPISGADEELITQAWEVITYTGAKRLFIYNRYSGTDPTERSTFIISTEKEFIVFYIKPNQI